MYERGLLPETLDNTVTWEKSPFIQGFLTGLKGAVLGGSTGAGIQALRGKNPIAGGLIGGLGTGILAGIIRAAAQKSENIAHEEAMRYHIDQLKSREPLLFMPPPSVFGRVFHNFHEKEVGRAP